MEIVLEIFISVAAMCLFGFTIKRLATYRDSLALHQVVLVIQETEHRPLLCSFVYIVDISSRAIDTRTNIITTIVGSNTATALGDGGPATSAMIHPQGVWANTYTDSNADSFSKCCADHYPYEDSNCCS